MLSTRARGGASAARRCARRGDARRIALDLDGHAGAVVAHPAVERERSRRAGRRRAGNPRPARCRALRCACAPSAAAGEHLRDARQHALSVRRARQLAAPRELRLRARQPGAAAPRRSGFVARSRARSRPRSSQASHSSKPAPVCAESSIASSPGPDPPRVVDRGGHIELHVRQQVDLVDRAADPRRGTCPDT